MTNQREIYKRMEAREKELWAALLKVQQEGEDKGLTYAYGPKVVFACSPYWFGVETFSTPGRLHDYYFACRTLEGLKNAIRWVLTDTAFYDVTAFVDGFSYVSFTSAGAASFDREFDYYYSREVERK